jgi:hypothetical protein
MLNIFKKSKLWLDSNALREALFDAVEANDVGLLEELCEKNRERILAHFQNWRTLPEAQRNDRNVARYGRGLTAIANWFKSHGSSKPSEILEGNEKTNPIDRWQKQFGRANTLKADGHFDEAIAVLKDIQDDMNQCKGSAVDKYLPMVRGSLGECLFRTGDLESAFSETRAALDACLRNGDIEGIIIYCGNLGELCRKREEPKESRYWITVSTNLMIQAGRAEQALRVRKAHGIEPTTELISIKGPLG